jgi:hypothetical protein
MHFVDLDPAKTRHRKRLRVSGRREKDPSGKFQIDDLDDKRKDGEAQRARGGRATPDRQKCMKREEIDISAKPLNTCQSWLEVVVPFVAIVVAPY